MLRDALLHGTCANAFHLPWPLKVDFFGNARRDFDESELSRRRRVEVRPGGLDQGYMERWARALGVEALLARAQREALG